MQMKWVNWATNRELEIKLKGFFFSEVGKARTSDPALTAVKKRFFITLQNSHVHWHNSVISNITSAAVSADQTVPFQYEKVLLLLHTLVNPPDKSP